MRHTSILTSILILILHSYDIKAQNGKLYDVEGLLLIEHIYENGVYKPLWHTRFSKNRTNTVSKITILFRKSMGIDH